MNRWVGDSDSEVAQFFSKSDENTLIIRKIDIGKICNSKPLSYYKNIPVIAYPSAHFMRAILHLLWSIFTWIFWLINLLRGQNSSLQIFIC